MLFTVMETEYIQASTMKMGKVRFKVIMKLPKQEGRNVLNSDKTEKYWDEKQEQKGKGVGKNTFIKHGTGNSQSEHQ